MPRNKAGRPASGCTQQHAIARLSRFLTDSSPEQQSLVRRMAQVKHQNAVAAARRIEPRKD